MTKQDVTLWLACFGASFTLSMMFYLALRGSI